MSEPTEKGKDIQRRMNIVTLSTSKPKRSKSGPAPSIFLSLFKSDEILPSFLFSTFDRDAENNITLSPHFKSKIFLTALKSPVFMTTVYMPFDTGAPESAKPFHTTEWIPDGFS